MVLSFSVMADTKNTTEISGQQIKQEIPQKLQQTDTSGKEIKDRHSAKLLNLKLLIKSLQVKDAEIKQLSKELEKLKGEEAKEKSSEISEVQNERKELRLKMESLATGADIKDYRNKVPAKFNFAEEIQKLLRPMVHSLNSVTQDSREIEELKQEIEEAKLRKEIAITATNNLTNLLNKAKEKSVEDSLGVMLSDWKEELENIKNDENIYLHCLR
jgi:chromosome segregation ATPase